MPTETHEPPDRLSEAAKEVWHETIKELEGREGGRFTSALLDMVERYCFLTAECRDMQDKLFREPTIEDVGGRVIVNPLIKAMHSYNQMISVLSKAIGLVSYQPAKVARTTKERKALVAFAKGG